MKLSKQKISFSHKKFDQLSDRQKRRIKSKRINNYKNIAKRNSVRTCYNIDHKKKLYTNQNNLLKSTENKDFLEKNIRVCKIIKKPDQDLKSLIKIRIKMM